MTKAKRFFGLICILTFCTLLCSFDYSKYTPVSLNTIDDYVNGAIQQSGKSRDIIFNGQSFRINLDIRANPVPINNQTVRNIIQSFSDTNKFSESYGRDYLVKLYTHFFNYKYKDKTYVFLFQNSLVNDFVKEVKTGKNADLYCMLGVYSLSVNSVYIFVNEFEAK